MRTLFTPFPVDHRLSATLVLCLAALTSPLARAATLEGQSFDNAIRFADSTLRLNGLGMRAVYIIKGYVAGLYLTGRATTEQEVKAMPGPKRVQMRMLLSVDSIEFNKALVSGIRKNATQDELARLDERIVVFGQAIKAIGTLNKGDVINLDFVPDQGMTMTVNGTRRGPVIMGSDFYDAVLGIFVGNRPVDAKLKRGLLGQ